MHEIRQAGGDLAKNVIQVYAVDKEGRAVMNRRLSRTRALEFFEGLDSCVIGMEACGGAHNWARTCQEPGHQARMMPAQYVKPFVKTSKNDAADAQAVHEAMSRPTMRFVQVKGARRQSCFSKYSSNDQA